MATSHDRAVLNSLFNPLLPVGECFEENNNFETDETNCPNESKIFELEGVRLAESNEMESAVNAFNEAIKLGPRNASAYNNRAQALRLLGEIDGSLLDLEKALKLSEGKGFVASQALCQRGVLYKLRGEDQLALEDFKMAARLGSAFAKSLLVQMNPYAALCNKMLAQMMAKLQNGEEI